MDNYGEIIIYQTEDGLTKITVNMKNETVGCRLNRWRSCFREINRQFQDT